MVIQRSSSTTSESAIIYPNLVGMIKPMSAAEDISRRWPLIQRVLDRAVLPPSRMRDDFDAVIKTKLLSGQMEAIVGFGEEGTPAAIVITEFVLESGNETKNLEIYALASFRNEPLYIWKGWLRLLKRRARAMGAVHLVAYTNNSDVVQFAQQQGANAEWTLLKWDTEEERTSTGIDKEEVQNG